MYKWKYHGCMQVLLPLWIYKISFMLWLGLPQNFFHLSRPQPPHNPTFDPPLPRQRLQVRRTSKFVKLFVWNSQFVLMKFRPSRSKSQLTKATAWSAWTVWTSVYGIELFSFFLVWFKAWISPSFVSDKPGAKADFVCYLFWGLQVALWGQSLFVWFKVASISRFRRDKENLTLMGVIVFILRPLIIKIQWR